METGIRLACMFLVAAALSALAGMARAAETWQPTSMRDDVLQAFAEKGDTLFGGSATAGIRASTDGGRTWHGITSCFGGSYHSVLALHASGDLVVASFDLAGICLSRDGGATWVEANAGLPVQRIIHDVVRIGDTLVAAARRSGGGVAVYRAPVSGEAWFPSATGLDTGVRAVSSFALDSQGVLYAGIAEARTPSPSYVYSSRNAGSSWEPVPGSLPDVVYDLAWADKHLIAATGRGVFRSSDGAAWEDCGPDFTAGETYALAARGSLVYAGSGNVVFRSRDGGGSWLALQDGLPGPVAAIGALWIGTASVLAGVAPSYGVWMLESTLSAQRPPVGASASPGARRLGPGVDALGRVRNLRR